MSSSKRKCARGDALRDELTRLRDENAGLSSNRQELRAQLHELAKLVDLQRADLERYRQATASFARNPSERVDEDQLQLAFERVLAAVATDAQKAALQPSSPAAEEDDSAPPPAKKRRKKKRHAHGRRDLCLENLPIDEIVIEPPEVIAAGGKGFVRIGEEVSHRLALRQASYRCLRIVRPTYKRTEESAEIAAPAMITAPLPDSVWPCTMADPSAIAQVIISKYDDSLPLHRQEKISTRNGFAIPRSTQCSWLTAAHNYLVRIVDAMFEEAKAHAFCIATDATGAPVRRAHGTDRWHVFVFIADYEHVIFRYAPEHTSVTIADMLRGFRGYLLADAAKIFDTLYRDLGMTEVGCFFHLRRYFWRAVPSDPGRAHEALAIIGKLFEVARSCAAIPMPKRTAERAARALPVLDLHDRWIEENREVVDPRGPLHSGIGYYKNQRTALRRFLEDGRLRLDNNLSEQALRNLVLGRANWMSFANETRLRWYCLFRSLIASCNLHGHNPQNYLEEVLRLAPHWKVSRILELAPRYWARTKANLTEVEREILARPWERSWPVIYDLAA